MEKKRYNILSKQFIDSDIVSMQIKAGDIAESAIPGQFISIYTDDKSLLLPRPISICDTDKDAGTVRIVFRIVGKGTEQFAGKEAGDTLDIIGPLGNGYVEAFRWINDSAYRIDAEEGFVSKNQTENKKKDILIIGGGIGIPPMLMLVKSLVQICNTNIVLGYRDSLFMNEDFEPYGDVFLSTEDGRVGTKGNVIDCIRQNVIKADIIMACGPLPMLKGIKAYACENNIQTWISLEEKMACGIGACLACVCKTEEIDEHSMVRNKRICKDGPVFDAKEVDFS